MEQSKLEEINIKKLKDEADKAIQNLSKDNDELKNDLIKCNQEKLELENAIEQFKSEEINIKQLKDEADKRVQNLSQEYDELKNDLVKFNQEKLKLENAIEQFKYEEQVNMKQLKDEADKAVQNLSQEKDELVKDLDKVTQEKLKFKNLIEQFKMQEEMNDGLKNETDRRVQKLHQENYELKQKESQLKNELEQFRFEAEGKIKELNDDAEKRILKVSKEYDGLKNELEKTNQEKSNFKVELEQFTIQDETNRKAKDEVDKRVLKISEENDDLKTDLEKLYQEKTKLKNAMDQFKHDEEMNIKELKDESEKRVQKLSQANDELITDLEKLNQENSKLKRVLEKFKMQDETNKKAKDEVDKRVLKISEENDDLKTDLEKLYQEKMKLKNAMEQFKHDEEMNIKELKDESEKRVQKLSQENDKLKKNLEMSNQEKLELKSALEEFKFEEENNIKGINDEGEKRIENISKKLDEVMNDLQKLSQEKSKIKKSLEQFKTQDEMNKELKDEADKKVQELSQENEELKNNLEKSNHENLELKSALEKFKFEEINNKGHKNESEKKRIQKTSKKQDDVMMDVRTFNQGKSLFKKSLDKFKTQGEMNKELKDEADTKFQNLSQENEKLKNNLKISNQDKIELKSALEKFRFEEEINVKGLKDEGEKRIQNISKNLDEVMHDLQKLNQGKYKLKKSLEQFKIQEKTNLNDIQRLKQENEKLKNDIERLNQEKVNIEKALAQFEAQKDMIVSNSKDDLSKINQQMDQDLKALKQHVEDLLHEKVELLNALSKLKGQGQFHITEINASSQQQNKKIQRDELSLQIKNSLTKSKDDLLNKIKALTVENEELKETINRLDQNRRNESNICKEITIELSETIHSDIDRLKLNSETQNDMKGYLTSIVSEVETSKDYPSNFNDSTYKKSQLKNEPARVKFLDRMDADRELNEKQFSYEEILKKKDKVEHHNMILQREIVHLKTQLSNSTTFNEENHVINQEDHLEGIIEAISNELNSKTKILEDVQQELENIPKPISNISTTSETCHTTSHDKTHIKDLKQILKDFHNYTDYLNEELKKCQETIICQEELLAEKDELIQRMSEAIEVKSNSLQNMAEKNGKFTPNQLEITKLKTKIKRLKQLINDTPKNDILQHYKEKFDQIKSVVYDKSSEMIPLMTDNHNFVSKTLSKSDSNISESSSDNKKSSNQYQFCHEKSDEIDKLKIIILKNRLHLKSTEINTLKLNLDQYKDRIDELESQLFESQQNLNEQTHNYPTVQLENENSSEYNDSKQLLNELNEMKCAIQKLIQNLDEHKLKEKYFNDQIELLECEIKEKSVHNAVLKDKFSKLQKKLCDCEISRDQLSTETNKQTDQQSELNKEDNLQFESDCDVNTKSTETKYSKLLCDYEQSINKRNTLLKVIKDLETEISVLKQENIYLENKLNNRNTNNKIEKLSKLCEQSNEKIKEKSNELSNVNQRNSDLYKQIQHLNEKLTTMNLNHKKLTEQYYDMNKQMKSLEKYSENLHDELQQSKEIENQLDVCLKQKDVALDLIKSEYNSLLTLYNKDTGKSNQSLKNVDKQTTSNVFEVQTIDIQYETELTNQNNDTKDDEPFCQHGNTLEYSNTKLNNRLQLLTKDMLTAHSQISNLSAKLTARSIMVNDKNVIELCRDECGNYYEVSRCSRVISDLGHSKHCKSQPSLTCLDYEVNAPNLKSVKQRHNKVYLELDKAQTQLINTEDRLSNLQEEYEQLTNKYCDLKQVDERYHKLYTDFTQLRITYDEMKQCCRRLQHENEVLRDKCQHIEIDSKLLQQPNEPFYLQLEETVSNQYQEIEKLKSANVALSSEYKQCSDKLKQLENHFSKAKTELNQRQKGFHQNIKDHVVLLKNYDKCQKQLAKSEKLHKELLTKITNCKRALNDKSTNKSSDRMSSRPFKSSMEDMYRTSSYISGADSELESDLIGNIPVQKRLNSEQTEAPKTITMEAFEYEKLCEEITALAEGLHVTLDLLNESKEFVSIANKQNNELLSKLETNQGDLVNWKEQFNLEQINLTKQIDEIKSEKDNLSIKVSDLMNELAGKIEIINEQSTELVRCKEKQSQVDSKNTNTQTLYDDLNFVVPSSDDDSGQLRKMNKHIFLNIPLKPEQLTEEVNRLRNENRRLLEQSKAFKKTVNDTKSEGQIEVVFNDDTDNQKSMEQSLKEVNVVVDSNEMSFNVQEKFGNSQLPTISPIDKSFSSSKSVVWRHTKSDHRMNQTNQTTGNSIDDLEKSPARCEAPADMVPSLVFEVSTLGQTSYNKSISLPRNIQDSLLSNQKRLFNRTDTKGEDPSNVVMVDIEQSKPMEPTTEPGALFNPIPTIIPSILPPTTEETVSISEEPSASLQITPIYPSIQKNKIMQQPEEIINSIIDVIKNSNISIQYDNKEPLPSYITRVMQYCQNIDKTNQEPSIIPSTFTKDDSIIKTNQKGSTENDVVKKKWYINKEAQPRSRGFQPLHVANVATTSEQDLPISVIKEIQKSILESQNVPSHTNRASGSEMSMLQTTESVTKRDHKSTTTQEMLINAEIMDPYSTSAHEMNVSTLELNSPADILENTFSKTETLLIKKEGKSKATDNDASHHVSFNCINVIQPNYQTSIINYNGNTENCTDYDVTEQIYGSSYYNDSKKPQTLLEQPTELIFYHSDSIKKYVPLNYACVEDEQYPKEEIKLRLFDSQEEKTASSKIMKEIPHNRDLSVLFNSFQKGSVENELRASELDSIPEEMIILHKEVGSPRLSSLAGINFDSFDDSTNLKQKIKFYIAELDYLNELNVFNNYVINTILHNESDYCNYGPKRTSDSDNSRNSGHIYEGILESINEALMKKLNNLIQIKAEVNSPYHLPEHEISIIEKITKPDSKFSFIELFNTWQNNLNKLRKLQLQHSSNKIRKMAQMIDTVSKDNNRLKMQLIEVNEKVSLLKDENEILHKQIKCNNLKKTIDENKFSQTRLTSRIPHLKDKSNDHPSVPGDKHCQGFEKKILTELKNVKKSLILSVDHMNQMKTKELKCLEILELFVSVQKVYDKMKETSKQFIKESDNKNQHECKMEQSYLRNHYLINQRPSSLSPKKLPINQQFANIHANTEASHQKIEFDLNLERFSQNSSKKSNSPQQSIHAPLKDKPRRISDNNSVRSGRMSLRQKSSSSKLNKTDKKSISVNYQGEKSNKLSHNIYTSVKTHETTDSTHTGEKIITGPYCNVQDSKSLVTNSASRRENVIGDESELMKKSIGRNISLAEVRALISAESSTNNLKKFGMLLAEDNFHLASEVDKLLITIEALRIQLKENCEILSETVDMLQNSEVLIEDLQLKLDYEASKNNDTSIKIENFDQRIVFLLKELERMMRDLFHLNSKELTDNNKNVPIKSTEPTTDQRWDQIVHYIKLIEKHFPKLIMASKSPVPLDQIFADNISFEFETSLLPDGHLFGSITIFDSPITERQKFHITFTADLLNFDPTTGHLTNRTTNKDDFKITKKEARPKTPKDDDNGGDDDNNNSANSRNNTTSVIVNRSFNGNNTNKKTVSSLVHEIFINNNQSTDSFFSNQSKIQLVKRSNSMPKLTKFY